MMTDKINNKRRPSNKNVVTNPAKDLEHRFCRICNLGLVMKEHNVYNCPRCNCTVVLSNTQPDVKIRTNFPTFDPSEPNKLKITQSQKDKLPRSEYFIQKRQQERNKTEIQDPYLQTLMNNNKIRITSTDYYSYDDDDYNH